MLIFDYFIESPSTSLMDHRYISRDGNIESKTAPVIHEHTMNIQIQGGSMLRFVCLPGNLPQLILGHLLTEGYIQTAEDVASITIDSSGHSGTVILNLDPNARYGLKMALPTPVNTESIFSLADAFARETTVHNQTFAAHSCFLAHQGELVFSCEDIGRHNALDKAVGYALLHHLNPQDCLLYSSGRMPIDMVSKAIRAGFPILISKGAPTAGAVKLAREYNLTLICSARKDGFKLYSGA